MSDQQLRDNSGRIIGTIKTFPDGKQEVRDASGRVKGTYDPKTNQTRDSSGRTVGTGNLLAALLTRI